MRKIWFSSLAALSTLTPAVAASPLGNWLVEEKTAQVRIVDCGSVLWGVFSWEKVPGLDTNNPDPTLRNKPILGSSLLRGMKQTGPNEWQGKVYNPQDGKQYDATISLRDDQTLNLKGCLIAFLCQTVPWTRVPDPTPVSVQPPAKSPPKAAPKGQPSQPKPIDFVKDPDADICSMIPGAAPSVPVTAGGARPTH
jgi:uncharacterized protein (DUF2147 family)